MMFATTPRREKKFFIEESDYIRRAHLISTYLHLFMLLLENRKKISINNRADYTIQDYKTVLLPITF